MKLPETLPFVPDAERAVLGSLLFSPKKLPDILGRLRGEAFVDPVHQAIYKVMKDSHQDGQPIDPLLLSRRLRKHLAFRGESPAEMLGELLQRTPTAANLDHYANLVHDAWVRRSLVQMAESLVHAAVDERHDSGPLATTIAGAASILDSLAADANTPAQRSVAVMPLADVEPVRVQWLWPGRIALGKLTLLAGDPGLGKSFLSLDLAARVSQGSPWPGTPLELAPKGGVVLLSAEDDLADTIRPRLDAAGAAVGRIVAVTAAIGHDAEGEYERSVDLARDLKVVEEAIKQVADCRLVVVDPISAYLGRTDSHRNAEVRSLLAPLSEMAARRNLAVVAITHLRKGGGPAIYRSMGSLAFAAAARAAWLVTKDRDDPLRRLFLPVKNNLAEDVHGLAYRLEPGPFETPIVAWEHEPISITADDALAASEGSASTPNRSAVDEASGWLQEALANGPVLAKELQEQSKSDGIALNTLKRAKLALGILACPTSKGGPWSWRLPPSPDRKCA